jgi:hypothetical protein
VPEAVSVSVLPAHNVVDPDGVRVKVALLANVVTADEALAVQPLAAVPTTV